MKLTRRSFILASAGSFLLSIFGMPKTILAKSQPEPLPQGEYSAIVLDIETGYNGYMLVTYQVQGKYTDKWFPLMLEKSHE
jgi:hypothetical protein